jgi:ABC-type branched-subunit amino acid transport system ATPase component
LDTALAARWHAPCTNPNRIQLDGPTEGIRLNIVEEIEHLIVRWNREGGAGLLLVTRHRVCAQGGATFRQHRKKTGRVAATSEAADLTEELVHRHRAGV